MKIGIVGGGIMGITLGYFLTRQGIEVEIFEASPVLGGLAGPLSLEDGTSVDRFYHAILPSDGHLYELLQELGIADQLRFRPTKTGFYYQGKIYSMNNIVEFLFFPPLGWIDRFRLGLTVMAAQLERDWRQLESVSVEEWLVRFGGRNTFQNIWRPMLRAKFDGGFSDVPATWIWSRLVRVKSARSGASQQEGAGHLIGGYYTLMRAMAAKIEAAGNQIHLRCPVQEVLIECGLARGIRCADEMRSFDAIVVTMQAPIFRRLIPAADPEYLGFLDKTRYLGVVCPLLVLDRPLTGYWTLNITDESIPFTGIIETTSYIDPKYVGGHHLVYLPKYTSPDSRWYQMSDAEIKEVWLQNLTAMFPDFDRRSIRYFLIHRERYVEPLHPANSTQLIPPVETPIGNLYLATTAQIYPALTNGESVSRHARGAADAILKSTPVRAKER